MGTSTLEDIGRNWAMCIYFCLYERLTREQNFLYEPELPGEKFYREQGLKEGKEDEAERGIGTLTHRC